MLLTPQWSLQQACVALKLALVYTNSFNVSKSFLYIQFMLGLSLHKAVLTKTIFWWQYAKSVAQVQWTVISICLVASKTQWQKANNHMSRSHGSTLMFRSKGIPLPLTLWSSLLRRRSQAGVSRESYSWHTRLIWPPSCQDCWSVTITTNIYTISGYIPICQSYLYVQQTVTEVGELPNMAGLSQNWLRW